MTDEHDIERDDEIARALEGIAVPGYEPGFWDRLGTRLDQEGAPVGAAEVHHLVVTPAPDDAPSDLVAPIDLPVVVPLASPRREQRRSLAVLAVAAAAILAILVVRLGTDQPDELRVAGGTGGQQVAPDDGTTTPDEGPEQDGASRPGDDDDGGPAGEDLSSDDPVGSAGDHAGTLLSPGTTLHGSAGEATGPSTAAAVAAPTTAQGTFVAWASAIDRGDVDEALALTGPRTIAYYDALGADMDDVLTESQEGWGAWADPEGRRVRAVELGEVDGDRAVGLVLDRPDPSNDDADVRVYDAVPVVRGDQGWTVEFAAFDPSRDGRIEMISPAPGTDTQDLPKGEVIRVAAQRTGEYYLNLDLAQSTRIRAADAVDGEISWDPSGLRSTTNTGHLLVVAHLDEGQVTMLVRRFLTRP